MIITFVITGAACGLAGLIDASTTGSGSSDMGGLGGQLALLAIAGVALGGTSIFGGVGSVWRTVLGVLILGMITNGFDLLGRPGLLAGRRPRHPDHHRGRDQLGRRPPLSAHAWDYSAEGASMTPRAISVASAVRIASIAAGTPQ